MIASLRPEQSSLIEPSVTNYLALRVISNLSALGIYTLTLMRPKKIAALALMPRPNLQKFSTLALMSASAARVDTHTH